MCKGHELVECGENRVICLKCRWTFFVQPFGGLADIPPCVMEVR